MFQRVSRIVAATVVAIACCLFIATRAQAQANKQDPPAKPLPVVIKLQAAQKGKHAGQEVLLVSGIDMFSGKPRAFAVENQAPQNPNSPRKYDPNPGIKAEVEKVKPGEYLKIEPKAAGGYGGGNRGGGYGRGAAAGSVEWIDQAEPYIPVEHEEEQGTFILFSAYEDKLEGGDVYKIELQKFGRIYDCYAAMVKEEKKLVPDPAVVAAAAATEKKALIEATVTQQGKYLFVSSIDKYQAPRTATLTKVTEVDADGIKIPAVELSESGTAVTLMLPGKLVGKRWTPDAAMLATARRTKPGSPIVFKTRDADQKSYVRMLAPAPKETQKKDAAPSEMKK